MGKGKKEEDKISTEDYSSLVNGSELLLTFEGWIKYVEGFTRGLQTTDKVNSAAVLDCVGEILEYMISLRGKLYSLLLHCETILQDNEDMKLLADKESSDGKDL
jgi:hypothetical protein